MGIVTQARERLSREDVNYRRLVAKHREHDEQLQELQARRYLSDDDKLEEVRLKKLKLALKDEMEKMVRLASP